jgi:hypothetical protein
MRFTKVGGLRGSPLRVDRRKLSRLSRGLSDGARQTACFAIRLSCLTSKLGFSFLYGKTMDSA